MSILCWLKQAHIVLVKSPVDRSCDLGQFPSSCNNICARIYSWYTYEIYEKWWFSITFCVSLPEAKILGWNILRPLEVLPSWMPMLETLLRNPHVWWLTAAHVTIWERYALAGREFCAGGLPAARHSVHDRMIEWIELYETNQLVGDIRDPSTFLRCISDMIYEANYLPGQCLDP